MIMCGTAPLVVLAAALGPTPIAVNKAGQRLPTPPAGTSATIPRRARIRCDRAGELTYVQQDQATEK